MENEFRETEYFQITDQDGNVLNVEADEDGVPACDYFKANSDGYDIWLLTADTENADGVIIGVFYDEKYVRDNLDAIIDEESVEVWGKPVSAREFLKDTGDKPSLAERGETALQFLNRHRF